MDASQTSCDQAVHQLRLELRRVRRLLWAGPLLGFAAAAVLGASRASVAPQTQNFFTDTLTVRMIQVIDPNNRPVAMFGSTTPQAVLLGLGGGDQPSVALSSSPALAVVAATMPRSGYRAMLSAISQTGVVALTVQDRNSRLAWGVSQTPNNGLVQGMRNQYGDYPTGAMIGQDGSFQFHVQKSALEQAGDVLTWAAALRDLFQ